MHKKRLYYRRGFPSAGFQPINDTVDGKNPSMRGQVFSFCLSDFGGKMDSGTAGAMCEKRI